MTSYKLFDVNQRTFEITKKMFFSVLEEGSTSGACRPGNQEVSFASVQKRANRKGGIQRNHEKMRPKSKPINNFFEILYYQLFVYT